LRQVIVSYIADRLLGLTPLTPTVQQAGFFPCSVWPSLCAAKSDPGSEPDAAAARAPAAAAASASDNAAAAPSVNALRASRAEQRLQRQLRSVLYSESLHPRLGFDAPPAAQQQLWAQNRARLASISAANSNSASATLPRLQLAPLTDFAGTYSHAFMGDLVVSYDSGSAVLSARMTARHGTLAPLASSEYFRCGSSP
jgi:hypothetical protein